jgi:polyhydroxyalkanoate synthesis regulator phasin
LQQKLPHAKEGETRRRDSVVAPLALVTVRLAVRLPAGDESEADTMRDALRGYLTLATGLTEVTRERATAAARTLASQGEATAEQVQSIALDLVATSQSNRAALTALVRYEVDRTLSRFGLATAEEIAAMAARLQTVEAELRELRSAFAASAPASPVRSNKTGNRTLSESAGTSRARNSSSNRARKSSSTARKTSGTAKQTSGTAKKAVPRAGNRSS